MHKKIAAVGDKSSILAFKAVGFDVFETHSPDDTKKIIQQLAKNDYGVVFLTEQAYAPVAEWVETFRNDPIAIIPIPGKDGTLGLGMANAKKRVERAVGADILFKDEE